MTEFFYNLFSKFDKFLGTEGIFILCLSVISIVFLITVIRLVFIYRSNLMNRIWFIFAVLSVSGIEYSLAIITEKQTGYALLTLSVGFLYLIPVLTISTGNKERKKQIAILKS